MFKTLQTKNFINTLGVQTANLLGDYREFTVTCNEGTARIIYCKSEYVYRNFTKIATETGYTPKKTIGEATLQAGQSMGIRQMAIRAYYDGHGMVIGDNDYYECVYPKMYIRANRNAVTFTPTAVPDTYGTITIHTEHANPRLDCSSPYQYYPAFAYPVIIETEWKYGHCLFYMTSAELQHAANLSMLFLAHAGTDIKIHGATKALTSTYFDTQDNEYTTGKLHIEDNEILQYVLASSQTNPFDLNMQNVPNVDYIEIHGNLPQDGAQSVADVIAASTIYGKYTGSAGTYAPIIADAVDESPYWSWAD